MTDNLSNNNGDRETSCDTDEEMLYAQAVKELKEGEIIKGKVVSIARDVVVVDIGYKSEGQIPIKEFCDVKGEPPVKVGDEVEALLENSDDEKGYVVLSKSKANKMRMWHDIEDAYGTGKAIEGRIVKRVKGGYGVDLKGINAFLPGSHVDIKPVSDPDKLAGRVLTFKILQYDRRKPNIIVSRKIFLEEERERVRKDTVQMLEEGKIVEGTIKNITKYGVFVDLGGIDGLLHVTDISWGKVRHPADNFKIGDKISVKVLKFNKEENKVSLGLKQIKPNPWDVVQENYPVDSTVQGKIIKVMDYGVFLELEDGLEGLIHVSEVSWHKAKDVMHRLKEGDMATVKVLEVDPAARKISLSLKQLEPNPWDEIERKYPKGTKIKGMVKNITDFGIFVGVENGIDGLVHISDLSWKKVKHPSDLFQKAQVVEAEVVDIDKEKQRLALSIKKLQKDPWWGIEERYQPGIAVNGKITNITNFGAFVELEDGVEGLIHVSELNRSKKKGVNILIGDMVEVEVLNIDPSEKKIGLGLRGLAAIEQKTAT